MGFGGINQRDIQDKDYSPFRKKIYYMDWWFYFNGVIYLSKTLDQKVRLARGQYPCLFEPNVRNRVVRFFKHICYK